MSAIALCSPSNGESKFNFEDKFTENDAREFLKETHNNNIRIDFVKSVIAKQRLDLIPACIDDTMARYYLYQELPLAADSSFKDKVTIMLIRTPWGWPNDNPVAPRSGGGYVTALIEPFISIIKKYFPDLPLTEELLRTRKARLKLATELEAAIAQEANKEETEQRQSKARPDTSVSGESNQTLDSKNVSSVQGNQVSLSSESPPWMKQLWIALVVCITGLVCVGIKKWRY